MTFEEWSQWFQSLEGIKEVLEMKPYGSSKTKGANNNSAMYGRVASNVSARRDRSPIGGQDKNSSFNSGR